MNRKAMKVMKKLITIIMALSLICFGLAGCKNDTSSGIDASKPQKVLVTMENGKTFTIKTSPQNAPETSKNFLELVDSGFYKYHEAYHLLKFANERQILEKAYAQYQELKKKNQWREDSAP